MGHPDASMECWLWPGWTRCQAQQSPQPQVISYSTLISACRKDMMTEWVLQHVDKMRQQGPKPDVITYYSLISACVKGMMAEIALQFFDEMRQRGLQSNVITYSAVFRACEKRDARVGLAVLR